jgi:hypothetical protein
MNNNSFENLYQMFNSDELKKNGIDMPELFAFLKNLHKPSKELNCDERKNRVKCLNRLRDLIKTDKFDAIKNSKNGEYVKNLALNMIDVLIKDAEYEDKSFKYMCIIGIIVIIALLACILFLLYEKRK